jgi:hypothetical protein
VYLGYSELSSVDVPTIISPAPAFREDCAGGGSTSGSKGNASAGVLRQEKTVKVSDQQGPEPMRAVLPP